MTNKGQFVKITEEMIKKRAGHDTEVVEKKTCPIKFDLTKVQVFSIDSCIPFLNDEGGRVMFFTNVSSICDGEDEDNNTKYSQCPVELRMTPSTMQRIISSLAKEVLAYKRYETEKTELEERPKKHHQENDILYS
jgi:hypothetical protein